MAGRVRPPVCVRCLCIFQVMTFEPADGERDPDLDAADFEAIEYINRKFPSEASLEGLDLYLARTDREVKQLDDQISEVGVYWCSDWCPRADVVTAALAPGDSALSMWWLFMSSLR